MVVKNEVFRGKQAKKKIGKIEEIENGEQKIGLQKEEKLG